MTAIAVFTPDPADPSYAGQIVVQTAPHIGNTGVNTADMESRRVWVRGYAVREAASGLQALAALEADPAVDLVGGVDDLVWHPVRGREGRTENFVATDDIGECVASLSTR